MMNLNGSLALRAIRWILALAIATAFPAFARAQANDLSRNMNQPVPPFHIIGNIYYVGASDITSYLIVTSSGDILLDGGFVETGPQIEANIKTLGFKLSDVKILISSHEHLDHAGGFAELKHSTGAQLVAMAEEVPGLASGKSFPAVTPDRVIHDGDTVSLGGVTMTAHLTPGHTRGCTTWSMVTRMAASATALSSSEAPPCFLLTSSPIVPTLPQPIPASKPTTKKLPVC